KQGRLPPPPPELEGMDLKVKYTSIMASAQKIQGLSSVERLFGIFGSIVQLDTSARDKVDVDQTVDIVGETLSLPPGIVRPDEEVARIRQAQAQAEAQARQAEMLQAGAGAARDLSQSDMSGDNALTRILNNEATGAA